MEIRKQQYLLLKVSDIKSRKYDQQHQMCFIVLITESLKKRTNSV